MAISRRSLFHQALALAGGVCTMILATPGQADTKAAQKLVAYQPFPKDGHSCATCLYFEPPDECKVVEGPISAAGWCKLWVQKS
jgi:hypothetical protein